MSLNDSVAHFCLSTCLRSAHCPSDNVADPGAMLTAVSPIQHTGDPHMVNSPLFSSANLEDVYKKTSEFHINSYLVS